MVGYSKFAIGNQQHTRAWRIVMQIAFGLACAAAMIGGNALISDGLRGASPFALVYPGVVLATLFGHWRGGLTAALLAFAYGWYYGLPPAQSFGLGHEIDVARALQSAVSVAIVLLLAETFRRIASREMTARDGEIEQRAMMMTELEHRTKNNFAVVASMLELQRRNAGDPRISDALGLAAGRVHSFARAYAHLGEGHCAGSVEMKAYLDDMLSRLIDGAFGKRVKVVMNIAECSLPREVAVAIALFANEALTNCVKYAFPDGRPGKVEVSFTADGPMWQLQIADDGVGGNKGATVSDRPAATGLNAGLGTRLMSAFAARANARFEIDTAGPGRRVRLFASGTSIDQPRDRSWSSGQGVGATSR